MARFEERIYELGSQALAEQERQVSELRGRGSALLAAAAVIASLLARPVFSGGHPDGVLEWVAAASGLLGAAGVLVSVALLLRPYELGFSVNATATYRALFAQDIVEQPLVDLALADALHERREENRVIVDRLGRLLGLTLVCLVLETAGLATAAALA